MAGGHGVAPQEAVMARPISFGTIDFTEKPVGTSNPTYVFSNVLPGGIDLNVSFDGLIVQDSASSTSPGLAGNAFYTGPVQIRFDLPVSSISFRAGVFDSVGHTKITIYGRNGFVVEEVLNTFHTPAETVYEPFSFNYGENAIERVVIQSVGAELQGFAIDDVHVTFRPEIREVKLSGDITVDGLLDHTKWNGHSVTYSFLEPGSRQPGYGDGPETFDGSQMLKETTGFFNDAQKAMTRKVLGVWDNVADLRFHEKDDLSEPGMMRFGTADLDAPAATYHPSLWPEGGDVRLDTGRFLLNEKPGTHAFFTVLHEVGHALGFKHPHDSGLGLVVPAADDSVEFSVMSYRSYPGGPITGYTNADTSFPQTLMMNDIAAIQYLYGPNFKYHSGDDTYIFNPSDARVFETIWDGGGSDTYSAQLYHKAQPVSLDLRPGMWSVLDVAQLAILKPGPGVIRARGNVYNAYQYKDDPRSLIENAIGGDGDDKIVGNVAANKLQGHSGNDRLEGLAAADKLFGGRDNDTLHGGSGKDQLVGGKGKDLMAGGNGSDSFLFEARDETGVGGHADRIIDFVHGVDEILLAPIDAREGTSADNAFNFIGKQDFTGAGQLRYYKSGGNTYVSGNVNHDLAPDFEIRLDGSIKLTGGDFDL